MSDFEKIKRQVKKLEQRFTDLAVQQWDIEAEECALVQQADLTPAQARQIKKLFDEFDRKREVIHEKHPDYTQDTAFDIADRIVREDDSTKQAKNPQKALDRERERQQRDEMEDDRSEAKREARENGENWSDIAEEWEADWIESNWDDERERQFQSEFKEAWKDNHEREFPNSDYAPKAGKSAA